MVVPALLVAGVVGLAYAKLPQPPMDDAAKAKAAEAKAKAGAAAKKGAEALAKSQDRVAERYKREKGMTSAVAPKMKK
ncbi:MAG TPA: hypothetical protein VLC73_07370 [Burkholderiales bacterium]|nr:hypothetical protein [Burkholderiales bacterium]